MRNRIFLVVFLSIAFWYPFNIALASDSSASQEVTSENWERHPRIVEIRKLYNSIQSMLTARTLKYQKKDYTKLPRSCRGTYPTEYLALATDAEGHVRLYIAAQRISHDDLLTTQYFYNDKGRLRFAYITNQSNEFATIAYRVYVDEQGKVFWDVRTEAKKTTFGEFSQDSAMVQVITAEQARAEFAEAVVNCRE